MKKIIFYSSFLILIFTSEIIAQHTGFYCRKRIFRTIPDNGTLTDTINVSLPITNTILDVNLLIDTVIHTWDSDLTFYLRKGSIGVKVINKVGGSGDDFIGTLLNDSSGQSFPPNGAPFTGSFRPSDSLSRFNGQSPAGNWILAITDTVGGDTGYLEAWCLRIVYSGINGVVQTNLIPNTYRLYQNYPNPFNPVTKIKYGVPKNGYIKLRVYDELGKEVQIVDEGYKSANTYEAVFDATNLPSGVYYYKLEAEGFNDTKKMVIVK